MRHSFLKPLAIASVLLSLGAVVAVGGFTYHQSVQSAEHQAADLARLVEEVARRSLVEAEILLEAAAQELGSDPASKDFTANSPLAKRLDALHDGADSVANIYVADAAGRVLFMTHRYPSPAVSLADRPYYEFHRRHLDGQFIMGAVSRTTGRPGFLVSRRLSGPDGAFAGVLFITFFTDDFNGRVKSLDVGPKSIFGVYGLDGRIVLRHPVEPSMFDKVASGSLVYQLLERQDFGTYRDPASVMDGESRIIGWRKIGGYPLIAVAGISFTEVCEGWLANAFLLLGAALPALLGSVVFAGVALRNAAREMAARGRLEEEVACRTRDLATALERAELANKALSEGERRLRELAEAMPQLVWSATSDGVVDFYNRRAFEYQGLSREGDGNWQWMAVLHPDDREATARAWAEAVRTGRPYEVEHRVALANGEHRWHISRAVPILDAEGRVMRWYGTATDVHQLKMLEQQAHRASDSKSEFLAAASHDLRQPMQSLYLFAQLLDGQVTGEQGKRALTYLQQAMDTMSALLDALFDLSRLDARKIVPRVEAVPVREVLAELDTLYRPLAASKGLTLSMECEDAILCTDRPLLGRMLRNLMENALRYTRAGGISVTCRTEGRRLLLNVADTGIGIPAEHLQRVFDDFFQVGNSERDRGQGLGLGLAIVRRLSQVLDHEVRLSSVEGQGSVFSILVPLAAPVEISSERSIPCPT